MPETEINGANFYYQDHGKGFPIVFTHGLGSDHTMWLGQVPVFKKKYRVIVWDVRGHGRSEVTESGYSIPQFVEDLKGLLDHLGIDKAHIAGLSMGGWISWSFGIKYPGVCESLVLSDSAGVIVGMDDKTMEERQLLFEKGAEIAEKHGREKLADVTISLMFAKEFIDNNPEVVNLVKERIRRDRGIGYARTVKNAFANYWKASKEELKEKLGNIRIPTLVLVGDRDQLTPLPSQEALHQAIPGSRFEIINGAAHVPPIEKPDIWNELVLDFLDKL